MQHTLPDPGEITEVEDVVELGGSRQHLDLDVVNREIRRTTGVPLHVAHIVYLCSLPDQSCEWHQLGNGGADFICKAPFWAEVATAYYPKDLINGCIGRKGAVENGELPLETCRYVVPPSSWVDHSC